MARRLLSLWRGPVDAPDPPPARVVDVLAEVARERGLMPGEIAGPGRSAALVAARQEVMARAVEGGRTVTEVGRTLHRHHTTVLHGVQAHARRIAQPQGAGA